MTDNNIQRVFVFYPERSVPPRKSEVYFDDIVFRPGINTHIITKQWNKLQSHPGIQQYLKWNAIEIIDQVQQIPVFDPNQQASQLANLSTFSVKDAQKIIEETYDVNLLNTWLTTETRIPVTNSINQRITNIQQGKV